jgi:hypothetical protein
MYDARMMMMMIIIRNHSCLLVSLGISPARRQVENAYENHAEADAADEVPKMESKLAIALVTVDRVYYT